MATIPVDIINRALDECGVDEIGDLEEGSKTARAAERIYWPTLRQILSAAHWNFARKQQSLVLLADISGQATAQTDVPTPWAYMYEWPTDAVSARFVPRTYPTGDITGVPIFSSSPQAQVTTMGWNSPAPFIVASSPRTNPLASTWADIEGHDPEQTRVILTNELGAQLIYTGLMMYPDAWDALFEQAMVSALAARLAMPLADPKERRAIRSDNIQIARAAIDAARVRDGNEGWTVRNHTPDWIRARGSGAGWGGPGVLFYGWSSVPWLGEDAGGVF